MKAREIVAALAAFVAMVSGLLKAILGAFASVFVVTVTVDDWIAGQIAVLLNGDSWSRRPYFYLSVSDGMVFEGSLTSSRVFWYRRAPLWFRPVLSPVPGSREKGVEFVFSFVRWTFDWRSLLKDCEASYKNSGLAVGHGLKRKSIICTTFYGGEVDQRCEELKFAPGRDRPVFPLSGMNSTDPGRKSLALSPDLCSLIEEMRVWFAMRAWFEARGLSWRRGYFLHGPPGSGKTAFVREVARAVGISYVYRFDLASMSNAELASAFRKMHSPSILLLEDIDCVFHGRAPVNPSAQKVLTFDALLNGIDGIERNPGVLLFVTANHPEHVDPALRDRAGRVDRVVPFGYLEFAQRVEIAHRILGPGPEADRLVSEHDQVVAATFVEACSRVAIRDQLAGAGQVGSPPYR